VFPDLPITESPFFELPERIQQGASPEWESFLFRAREYLEAAHDALETHGVTTNLVFRLDMVAAQLARLDELLRLAAGAGNGRAFAAAIVRGFAEQRSLRALVDSGARRLARKVVEHTGRAGEHYIAMDRVEWRQQLWGGLGAGAVCVLMAAVKYAIPPLKLAPLMHGLAWTANYVGGFMTMQLLHLTLASKVPSMTAAALADAFERQDGLTSEIQLIRSIIRSQFLVTVTNLAMALPLGFAFSLLWQTLRGHPFMTIEEAEHGVHALHPLHSGTVIFAVTTGVSLWLSSLAAGWTGNWMTFRKIPAGIAGSRRLRTIVGRRFADRISGFVASNLAGLGGNIALGLLLGLAPMIAAFAGVPLEVRHVTLSSASLTMYFHALVVAGKFAWLAAGWALGAIAITGVINIGVSFALGLWLAMRSRGVDPKTRRELRQELWQDFRARPARFFLPR
jgi:site-specific recombinase